MSRQGERRTRGLRRRGHVPHLRLHDMGLTREGSTDHQRFEIDGADFAARFVESRGMTDGRVETIWDAIALHTSAGLHDSPVFARRRAPEIRIAQRASGTPARRPR